MALNFCLVGLGNHGKNRLLPQILKSKANLVAIVTYQKIDIPRRITRFKDLSDAVLNLEKNTIFILSTPPKVHQSQLIFLLKKGFSVITEKPSLISKYFYSKYCQIKKYNDQFLYENFMYEETKIYKKFLNKFNSNKDKIKGVEMNFLIPKFPEKSFRDNTILIENIIFDIACYPINLLNKIINFEITKYQKIKIKKNLIEIIIQVDNILVKIKVGINNLYQNNLFLIFDNNEIYKYDYLFYGVEKNKIISRGNIKSHLTNFENVQDKNAFLSVFNKNRKFFIDNQCNSKLLLKNLNDMLYLKKLSKNS